MNPESVYNTLIKGVIKDFLIIILIFAAISFIDFGLAAFIAVICSAILLTRRIILDNNPGFIKGTILLIMKRN